MKLTIASNTSKALGAHRPLLSRVMGAKTCALAAFALLGMSGGAQAVGWWELSSPDTVVLSGSGPMALGPTAFTNPNWTQSVTIASGYGVSVSSVQTISGLTAGFSSDLVALSGSTITSYLTLTDPVVGGTVQSFNIYLENSFPASVNGINGTTSIKLLLNGSPIAGPYASLFSGVIPGVTMKPGDTLAMELSVSYSTLLIEHGTPVLTMHAGAQVDLTPIPEPASYAAALGLATLGLVGFRRLRRQQSAA